MRLVRLVVIYFQTAAAQPGAQGVRCNDMECCAVPTQHRTALCATASVNMFDVTQHKFLSKKSSVKITAVCMNCDLACYITVRPRNRRRSSPS